MHTATRVEMPPVTITGRHVSVTESMRDHAEKKLANLNFDYPKVIDAKVLLDVEKDRCHKAEIILHCANHIVIEADSTTKNMYTSIDETIHKVARQMRKQKTRMLKSHRPDRRKLERFKNGSVDDMDLMAPPPPAEVSDSSSAAHAPPSFDDLPFLLHREKSNLRSLSEDEAVEELESQQLPFLVFNDARSQKLSVVYRREDGDYSVICPEAAAA